MSNRRKHGPNGLGRWLIALVTSVAAYQVQAADVAVAEISFSGNMYHYRFAVDVEAPIESVRTVVTDYDNMKRINNDVITSQILEIYDESNLKRKMWLNHCVLVFCFDLVFVENVETLDDGTIKTTVIPNESNFDHGISHWRVEAIDDARTRVSVEAEQDPAFWIPPVIGPAVLKRAFIKEIRETATNIEREARNVELE